MSNPNERPHTPWIIIVIGPIAGGLLGATVALGLALIVFLTPMCGLLGLDGEFDGLWVMGLPLFALPGGVIGGAVLSGTRKWRRGYTIALVCASLPAVAYFFINAWDKEASKNPRDVFVSTATISVCMVLSAELSLKLVGKCFAAIERRRNNRLNKL